MSAGMRMLGMRPAASGIFAIGAVAFAALGLVSCSADVSRFDYPMFAGEQASDNSLTTASVGPVPAEPVHQGGTSYGSSYAGASYTSASEQTVVKSELPPPGAPAGARSYQQPYQSEPYQSRPYQSQPAQSYPQRVASAEPARATPRRSEPEPATRAPLPEPEPKQTVHTVERGDTLAAIARKYDVGVAEIMKANKLSSTRLDIDQKLVIPGEGRAGATVASKASSETIYHVRSGDTLSSIARKHGMDYHDLARHNGLRTTSVLSLGQAIHIPAGAKSDTPEPVKVASRGDSIPLPSGNPSRADDAKPAPVRTRVAARPRPEAEKASLPDPAPMTGNNFRWPVRGRVISAFGGKPNGKHNDGINVAVPLGTSVKAAENGVVAYAGSELEGYGNLILIRHANGWVSAYAHNDEILVKRGDEVRRGQVISKAGKTGSVSQPQLHFELRKGSQPVDPLKHLANS